MSRSRTRPAPLLVLLVSALGLIEAAGRDTPAEPALAVPAGFEVRRVAQPPLVDRPIVADLDEEGRLYVADSSGSNDKVEQQLVNAGGVG